MCSPAIRPRGSCVHPDRRLRNDLPTSIHAAMNPARPGNALHGVTLEQMLLTLVENLGWVAMGRAIPIRCFTHAPGIASSLAFLRRTPWARAKVEALYLQTVVPARKR